MTRAALALPLMLAGCTPSPHPLAGFDDVAWVALLERDASGAITGGGEVRTFDQPLDVLSEGDASLVIVGWTADALATVRPDASHITPRTGCAPRLPAPTRAAALGDDDRSEALDAASLPPLSAPWASTLCPARDPTSYAFRVDCRDARSQVSIERSGSCSFDLRIDGVGFGARVEPDGGLCLDSNEVSCASTPARHRAQSTLACALPEPCVVDVYADPTMPPLSARRVALLDVAPYLPDASLTGAQPQLPPFGQYVGYTHDVAVLGDRIIASTSTGAARVLCGSDGAPSVLHALRVEDLEPLATVDAPSCLVLLARSGTTVVGLHVDGPDFGLLRIDADLRTLERAPLDTRAEPVPDGEPPRARAGCERPIDILVAPDRLFVIMERLPHCNAAGTSVHVLDARTLRVLARHDLEPTTPWKARLDGDRLLIAHATGRAVWIYDATTFAMIERRVVPPDLTRNDTVISDIAMDGDALLAATTRNQPALRRSEAGRDFEARGFFISHEADPVALVPSFAGELGLVIGTRDGDRQRWPTEAALYDPATLTVLPGAIAIGHGPPRRVRPDGRGGVVVLLPWEGALVVLRP